MTIAIRTIPMTTRLFSWTDVMIAALYKLGNSVSADVQTGKYQKRIPGAGIYPDDAEDKEGLIKCADAAMYKAKKETGNSYSLFREVLV